MSEPTADEVRRVMSALGRRGGPARSAAKMQACAENLEAARKALAVKHRKDPDCGVSQVGNRFRARWRGKHLGMHESREAARKAIRRERRRAKSLPSPAGGA